MHSLWCSVSFGVVLFLAGGMGPSAGNLSAQTADPRVGTWKLNVAQSS